MSNREYYGAPHRAPYPREYRHGPASYPRHQAPRHPSSLPYRGYPEHEAGAFHGRERVRLPYQSPDNNYDSLHSGSDGQPQVIDYANKRVTVERSQPLYEEDYESVKPKPVMSAPAQATSTTSFSGALSKISLTELKNTLGGQLGSLLSKGLSQQSVASDMPHPSQEQVQREQRSEDRYELGTSHAYSGERGEHLPDERNYSNQGVRRNEQAEGYLRPVEHVPSQGADHQRKPIFPIASSIEETPKSILKKSILKKSEPTILQSQMPQASSDPVDEDAFLYGSGTYVDPPIKASSEVLQDPQLPVTKPDTQKIISNPAFTALLKSIGLPDINMAEKVKEKQQLDEKQRLQASRAARQQQLTAVREETFGIDQSASFLSSEVVLDDLLKLKHPSKEISTRNQMSAYADRSLEKEDYKGDSRSFDKDQSVRDGTDRRREDDRHMGSGKFGETGSLRRRSRSPGKHSSRRRSQSPRRRSRSPRRHSRSPKRHSRSPRRRSRSPRRRSRSPRRRSRTPRRDRSRSPYRKSSALRDKDQGYNKSPSQNYSKEDGSARLKGKWTEVPSTTSDHSLSRQPETSEPTLQELSVGVPPVSRKRLLDNEESRPPLKSMKEEVQEEGFHDLLSKIPRDVKLTRAQFEDLMKAHQAKQEAAVRDRQCRALSPKETRNSSNISPVGSSSVTRKVIRDGDLFTNLTMVVRSDTSKPQVNAITDDELLGVKKSELPAPIKRSTSPAVIKDEPEGRRVVRRIGAIGSATLEKHAIESDKDKYLREFEKAELEKAFGKEPLLPRLSREEMSNIRQIIEFNKEKLLRAEQQLSTLQSSQSDVMKNLRRASVGEQYRLDKSLEQNIRLQNDLTSEIKNLKKLIREDELTLDEQFEQERKIREINRKKAAAAKAVESRAIPVKVASPPPEKQDRKYRRAMEDKMMGKQVAASSEAKAAEGLSKLPVSKPGTMTVQYYDPGTHWCKSCNFVAFKMYGYLEHLQSSSHMKRRHKIGKPWQPEEVIKPPRKSLVSRQETVVQPIKGVEFIHPVDSFYCLLCNFFTGDKDSIEYHLKSTEHHKQYETYITDNPMYEKRYKLDKERGLQEAKKLEEKRQEEQERQREAEREELERRREVERKRERELKEAEEKRKKAKLELLKARKKAEVLAITRGNQDDSDIEEVDPEEGPVESSANETSQERIKRSLLEKTRAKKTVKSSTEEPGVVEGETAVQRSIRLAKEAKSMQDRVRAKAAEIEQSVYGPKESTSLGPPGVFLPEQTDAAKVKVSAAGSSVAVEKVTTDSSSDNQAKLSVTSSSSLAPSSTKAASTTAPPSTTASSISPFVQKMMQMEKSGEIITTASVKAQQAAAVPQMLPNNQSYRPMQQGLMAMGPMPAPMGSAAMGPASMGPDPMGPAPVRPVSMGSAPVRPASMGPAAMGSAPMGPDSRGPSPMGPMRPRMAMQPAAHPVAMNVMGPRRPSPMRVMNRPTMPQQPMMGSMGPPRVPNRMMGPIANNWRNSMQTGPVAAHMMRPGMAPRCNRAPAMPQNKPIPQAAKSEEDSRELRPPGTDEQVDVPPGTDRQMDVPSGTDRPVNAPQGTDRQIDVPSGTDKPVNVPPVSDRQMDVPSGTDRPVNVPPVTDRQIDVPSGTDKQVDVPPGTDRQDCTKFTEQEGSSVKSHSCASSAASIVKPSHARQLQSPAENSSPSNSKNGEAIPAQSSNSVKIRAADNSDADTSDAGGTAVDSSAVDSTAVDSTAVDSTAVDSAAVDSTAVDSTAVDSTAVDSTAVDSTAVDSTAADSSAILEPSNITAQPIATSADADAGIEMKSSIESAPEGAPSKGAAETTSANDYGNMTRSPLAVEEMRQEDSQQNEIELESVEDMTFTVIDSVGDEDEKA